MRGLVPSPRRASEAAFARDCTHQHPSGARARALPPDVQAKRRGGWRVRRMRCGARFWARAARCDVGREGAVG